MKKAVSAVMLALLLGGLTLVFHVGPVICCCTIFVPDDYSTIQEAINHANDGDTIYVKEGLYQENLVVDKILSLVGGNRETTIIDGNEIGIVVDITRDNVNISGFTIQNGTGGIDA